MMNYLKGNIEWYPSFGLIELHVVATSIKNIAFKAAECSVGYVDFIIQGKCNLHSLGAISNKRIIKEKIFIYLHVLKNIRRFGQMGFYLDDIIINVHQRLSKFLVSSGSIRLKSDTANGDGCQFRTLSAFDCIFRTLPHSNLTKKNNDNKINK